MQTTEPASAPAEATPETAPVAPPVAEAAPAAPSLTDLAGLPRLRPLDFAPFDAALAAFAPERAAAIEAIVKDASIPQVQEAMQTGSLTAEELTLYFLSRIQQNDETLRHFLELNPAALDEARASDARRKDGRLIGPLDGIPINLKDNIETAGPMHTTGGSQILLNNVPAGDAPLVKNLRDAGAVILGKANLSEFAGGISALPGATAVGGLTINPHEATFTAGGSSSGSGASVAAYQTFASVGTETAGSLIAPSSWNGVVGMYPGKGVVDGNGVIPLLKTNDSAGPIGRSVTDVALLLGAIDTTDTDYLAGLNADALKNTKVGLLKADILAAPKSPFEDTSDNAQVVRRIEAGLTSAGAAISDTVIDAAQKQQAATILGLLVNGGIHHDMLPYLVGAGAAVTDAASLLAYNAADPGARIPFGQTVLEGAIKDTTLANKADFDDGVKQGQPLAAATLDAAFAASGADVLVSVNNYHSSLYATANYPAVSVPLGLRVNGMPVGVTFIGKPGSEAKLLAYAYAFEQATKARVNPDVAKTVASVNAPARDGQAALAVEPTTAPVALKWQPCSKELPAELECAPLQVPMDYADPNGPKVTLVVLRLKATDSAKRIGSLVFNPGGPGEGTYPLFQAQVLANQPFTANLREYFDIVGFEPRGVGLSTPVKCDPKIWNEYPSLFPKTKEEYDALVAHNKAFAQSCLERTGQALAHVDTVSVAHDLDAVRAALGEDKLNYLGMSYGTMIGAQYAELFPDKIGVMVLDGALDHSQTENAWHFTEMKTYEQVLERFAAWCGVTPDCALNGKDVLEEFDALVKKADAEPIPAPDCVSSGACRPTVTGDDIRSNVQAGLAGLQTWPTLGENLARAIAGDASAFSFKLKQEASDMDFSETAIQCLDWPAQTTSTFEGFENRRIFAQATAPHTQGAAQSWRAHTRCIGWPVPVKNAPRPLVVKGAPPILIVNATFDPSTSMLWALEMSSQLPSSVLLTRDGYGHTSYFNEGESQVRDAIEKYLITGETPPPNTVLPN
jgi:Asp-tRNA(Asn)/Glu-tRNA(Gln) amidotransferase A subunit family amidase/pimeloyl-ACP methyl ester carboxylesterase